MSVLRIVLATLLLAAASRAAEFECLIEPKVVVDVSTSVEGVIEKVHVDRGDRVIAGQSLVQLQSNVQSAIVEMAEQRATAEGTIARTEVNLRFAERNLEREEELSKTGVISSRKLDEAQSARELAAAGLKEAREDRALAEIELQRARADLEQRTIVSPVDGVVTRVHFSSGEFADSRSILEIAQIDPLHVEVFVPVAWFGRIEMAMEATVVPEAPVGGSHIGTVDVVDPVIDGASGTFGVRVALPNPEGLVPAGLGCRVDFPVTLP